MAVKVARHVIRFALNAVVHLKKTVSVVATLNFLTCRQTSALMNAPKAILEIWTPPIASRVPQVARNAKMEQNVCPVDQAYCLLVIPAKLNVPLVTSTAMYQTLVNRVMVCARSVYGLPGTVSSAETMRCWVKGIVLAFAQLVHFYCQTIITACPVIRPVKHAQGLPTMIAQAARLLLFWQTQGAWRLVLPTTILIKKWVNADHATTTVHLAKEVSLWYNVNWMNRCSQLHQRCSELVAYILTSKTM